MTTTLLKAAPLALLLLLPGGAPARAGDEPRDEKEIVLDAGRLLTTSDDEPLHLRIGRGARGGYLGVHLIDIPPELRAHFGAPRDAGVLVAQVDSDSPAGKAGIEVGDVITKVDGARIESSDEISRAVRRKKAGETAKIEVERDKSAKSVTATLDERKGRDLDLGDLRRRLRDREWMPREFAFDFHEPLLRVPESLDKVQEKLQDLDKRLRDLEKKVR